MLSKVNRGILYLLIALFSFGLFRLIVFNEIYPYALLLIGTLLSLGIYYALIKMSSIRSKSYLFLSVLAFINLILLFSDYFFPELLRSTWNYSFALLFLMLFTVLLLSIKTFNGKLARYTYWITSASGIMIGLALILKISTPFYFSIIFYSFLISSILILVLFGSKFKKVKIKSSQNVPENAEK